MIPKEGRVTAGKGWGMFVRPKATRLWIAVLQTVVLLAGVGSPGDASSHFDTPFAIANPQANIGDIFAWTSSDGRHLNLVMDIVGHSFSDKLIYALYVDSGSSFGKTRASTTITCRFPMPHEARCKLGNIDRLDGVADKTAGIEGVDHRFRVFAGLRDDPFFNNVLGTRAAYTVAFNEISAGVASLDQSGCPGLGPTTADALLYQWRHTNGGPATNLLARWTTSALVVSVNLSDVTQGGKVVAVWGTTATTRRQLERVGRPMTKNALLAVGLPDDQANRLKDRWNSTTPADGLQFLGQVEKSLALYDGFDGECGNQFLIDLKAPAAERYERLATLLVDDRLWVNTASTTCTQLFAVELAALGGRSDLAGDCGGRAPTYNAANVWRSLLVNGTTTGIDDGLYRRANTPSDTVFPFLIAPEKNPVNHLNSAYVE